MSTKANKSKRTEECIQILKDCELVIRQAGKLALDLRETAAKRNKSDSGIAMVDIVTEADLAVQELILSELAKTELIDCQIIAEEDTPSVKKFTGSNGLILTLDPIDGTFIYAAKGRFFSIILGLRDGKDLLFTQCYYPAVNWIRRITADGVVDIGELPHVTVDESLDLSKTISYTYGEPERLASKIYRELNAEGFTFRKFSEITKESGSTTMFFLNQVKGFYVGNPIAYDGLSALHYGKVKGLKTYSSIDLSRIEKGKYGPYHPGWYLVLND